MRRRVSGPKVSETSTASRCSVLKNRMINIITINLFCLLFHQDLQLNHEFVFFAHNQESEAEKLDTYTKPIQDVSGEFLYSGNVC